MRDRREDEKSSNYYQVVTTMRQTAAVATPLDF